jgi:hypothetical protein
MNMIPTNPISISVGDASYWFNLEEPSDKVYPPNTVVVLVERHEIADEILPAFSRTYIAVDEGMTSLDIMGWLGRLQPSYSVMYARIDDSSHRSQFLKYFADKIA